MGLSNITNEVSDSVGKVRDSIESRKAAVEGVLGLGSNGDRYSQNTAAGHLPNFGIEDASGPQQIGQASKELLKIFDAVDGNVNGNNNGRIGRRELDQVLKHPGNLSEESIAAVQLLRDNYNDVKNYSDDRNGTERRLTRADLREAALRGDEAAYSAPPEVIPPAPPEVTPPAPPEVTPPAPPEVTPPAPPEVTPPAPPEVTPPGTPAAYEFPRTLQGLGAKIVTEKFVDSDLDRDGFLRKEELRILKRQLETPLERLAVNRILEHFQGIKRSSNDQFGKEVGISLDDLETRLG